MCTSASRRAALGALAISTLLSACALGPDFHVPAPPTIDRYAPAGDAGALDAGDGAQTLKVETRIEQRWWRRFGSAQTDALVDEGLNQSPTLASARAALSASQDQARAGAGVFWPSLLVGGAGARERTTPILEGRPGSPTTFSLYTASGSVSYAIDLFGGQRRSVEALNAGAEAQDDALGSAYLILTSSIVEAAIAGAAYGDEVQALNGIVRLDADASGALWVQARAGVAPTAAALAADQQLGQDRQALALARQQAERARTLLTALVGQDAGAPVVAPASLADFTTLPDAPLTLPSQLVRQRPDILEAEANLHGAAAQVGVATAALFPSIELNGDFGAAGASLARLASPMGRFWSLGPSVDIPIFEGGARWYARKGAQAMLLKAQADYRQTVLSALEQVADALNAIETDALAAALARSNDESAELALTLAEANRQAGVISDYELISAKVVAAHARLGLIAARAQRLQDTVALYAACGGGWTGGEPGSDTHGAGLP